LPSAERATVVPKVKVFAGVESAVPADQVPALRVNTVTAPVPLSPPPGSPTKISFPLAEIATEVPKSKPVDGTAKAVPEDHPDPVEVYTVALPPVPPPKLLGSPTTAVDPFPETATDVPKELALAGRVRPVGGLSVEPL
jgi:hypothetical protein